MRAAPLQAPAARDWHSANQARLVAELAEIKALLRRHAHPNQAGVNGKEGAPQPPEPTVNSSPAADTATESRRFTVEEKPEEQGFPSALDRVCAAFGLSAFERSLL